MNLVEVDPNDNGRLNGNLNIPFNRAHLEYKFSDVFYEIKQKESKQVKILKGACGTLVSGRLTAILGPSGAGKTSILNILSGFKANGVSGVFTVNKQDRNLQEFRRMSSYIPQDFAMLELLTVEETLQISANLKLSKNTTQEEKCNIINRIIQILNMETTRHTLVRDISGGEYKRLSIGIELITNPPIMFFDEPTSGLDIVASLQIINYLRRLALDGRIIVCVIHQPSSRLMKLFDDILVISKGEVLYCGKQSAMISYFDEYGFVCPRYYNPADFVLEVGSEEHNPRIVNCIEKNKETHSTKHVIDSYVNERTPMLSNNSPGQTHQVNGSNNLNEQRIQCELESSIIRPKEQVSFWCQLSILIARTLRSLSRNMISVQLRLIMHIVVGLLLGIVFWQIGNDAAKATTNVSCLFFVVLFVFFGNSMPSILLCPQDMAVFLREYLNGWYSKEAYYLAKTISDLPMQFICPTVFITIVYFMTGQPNEIGRFAMCWGICLLTAIIGHFIGLVFGSTFSLQMSVFLVPSISIPFMIFSGFFIRIHEVPFFLRPLCSISFFRYTMEGLKQAIYGYNRPNMDCSTHFCYYKSPEKFLKDFNMLNADYGIDIFALCIWIVVLKVLFFLSLCYRIQRAQ